MTGPSSYRSFFLLLSILLTLAGAVPGFCEQPPSRSIRVVMDNNYPPFAFFDNAGNLQGILVDQWRLWEKKTGVRAELYGVAWGEAQRRMRGGEFDVIDTIFKTDQRLEWYDFTPPYQKLEVPISFHKDISGITDAASLTGFPVAVKAGDAAVEMLKRHGITNLLLYNNYEDIIRAAKERKINIFVVDKPPAIYFLNKYGISDQFRTSEPLTVGEFHRAVKKGNAELLGTLERGFASITPAEYRAIQKKWYGSDLDGAASLKYVAYSAGAAAIVIIILFLWNMALRRAVVRRTADLESERARLRMLLETIPDLVWLKDPNGVYLICNTRFERLYGTTEARIIGKNDYDFVDKELADSFREHDRKAIAADGPSINEEWLTFAADGHRELVETVKTPMRDADGMLIGVLGIARDITEMRRAEESLRESEARYRDLVEVSPYAIYVHQKGCFVFANPAGCLLLGAASPDELIGKPIMDRVHPDYRTLVTARIGAAQASGQPVPPLEELFLRLDGTSVAVEVVATSLTYHGEPAMQVLARDISDRKRLEDELVRGQKLESLGVLAGGIAHDFNNILTGILGNVSFARMLLGDGHKAARRLVECEKAAKRAGELTQQLLTFARGGEPIKKSVDARQLVEESLSFALRGANVKGTLNSLPDVWRMDADPGQMSQAFNNILINAKQAMPAGGTVTVDIDNQEVHGGDPLPVEPGRYVRISFTDQGSGIPPEYLAKIFDPYFTTKNQGSGLGLASVYSIVKRHGGMVTAASELGKGSVFTLLAPAARENTDEIQATDRGIPLFHGGGRILVMDDEELIRDLTVEMLNEFGFAAESCGDGREAVALHAAAIDEGKPYVAIMLDLTVPGGMGGMEAGMLIRTRDPQVPLLVSSGYSNDAVIAEYQRHGFSGVVVKPYSLESLVDELERVLKRDHAP